MVSIMGVKKSGHIARVPHPPLGKGSPVDSTAVNWSAESSSICSLEDPGAPGLQVRFSVPDHHPGSPTHVHLTKSGREPVYSTCRVASNELPRQR